jgi:hypothetical protein
MLRFLNLILFIFSILGVYTTYEGKYRIQDIHKNIAVLDVKIKEAKNEYDLNVKNLASLVTQERVDKLVEMYLPEYAFISASNYANFQTINLPIQVQKVKDHLQPFENAIKPVKQVASVAMTQPKKVVQVATKKVDIAPDLKDTANSTPVVAIQKANPINTTIQEQSSADEVALIIQANIAGELQ